MLALFALLAVRSASTDCNDLPLSIITETQEPYTFQGCTFDGQNQENMTQYIKSNVSFVITLTNCQFSNINTNKTGAIMQVGKKFSVTVTGCTFTNVGTTHNYGGCLHATGAGKGDVESNFEINTCEFTNVYAKNSGAAYYAKSTYYTYINKCKFTGFKADNGEGGAVFCSYQTCTDKALKVMASDFTMPAINTSGLVIKCNNFSIVNSNIKDCDITDINSNYSTYRAALVLSLAAGYADISKTNFVNNRHRSVNGGVMVFQSDVKNINLILSMCTFNNTLGSDIVFRAKNASAKVLINGGTFVKNSQAPTILQYYLKDTDLLKGVFNIASTCFYTTVRDVNSPAYLSFESRNIYMMIDVSNSFDVDSQEKAMNINAVIYGNVFDLHYCKPIGFTGPTPTPVPVNPPETEYCPALPMTVETTYTVKGCNYVSGSHIINEVLNTPTLTFESCTFKNMYLQTGQGGVINLNKVNFTTLTVKDCTFIKCGCDGNAGGCIWAENTAAFVGKNVFVENSLFEQAKSKTKGAAVATKNIEHVEVKASTFTDCRVVNQASESGIVSILPTGTNGPGYGLVQDCIFKNDNRCIATKVYDLDVKSCTFTDCYHQVINSNEQYAYNTGACIFLQTSAFLTNLLCENNKFHNVGYVDSTNGVSCGGAIYFGALNSTKVLNNEFINCVANKGGAIYVNKMDSGLITIDHNTFNGCNGDICFNDKTKSVISNNKFVKSNFRSSIYAVESTMTLSGNCFSLNYTGKVYGAHFIYLASQSSAIIEADNCFSENEKLSVYTYDSTYDTKSSSVYGCQSCSADAGANLNGPSKTNKPIATNTLIGIIVAVVVVIIIIIIAVVCVVNKKKKQASEEENPAQYAKAINEETGEEI